MMAESMNWSKAMQVSMLSNKISDKLRSINFILQIILGSISLILIVPTFIVARKVTKDFGWDIYKKIGSSLEIQGTYYIECLYLWVVY